MLEHLKMERQSGGGAQARLRAYMIGLLVLGGVIFLIATRGGGPGPEALPEALPDPEAVQVEAARVDLDRLPAEDTAATHARYQDEALAYVLSIADRDFASRAERLPLADLAALPFAEARGRVFETTGTVEAIDRAVYGGAKDQRLWIVLVEDEGGNRLLVLKHGLKSDSEEGRPQDALSYTTEFLEPGDRILLRGIYLQRRAGTFGSAIVREPIPVLVATPPNAAFRTLPEPLVPILDPGEADWDEVEDRFLSQTQVWQEPALFQVVQWARRVGYEKIAEAIRSGQLVARSWDLELFDAWGDEVASTEPAAPRPVTESLRGGFFKTSGLVASFLREGWKTLPREASAYDVDTLYLFDLMSDHWGNKTIRTWSPWPIATYPGVHDPSGKDKGQHVTVYGYFLKNFTYSTKQQRGKGAADITMPMFIVLHVEPVPDLVSPYRTMIWVISGVILLLFVVFYFVFVRGEKREAERMDAYRRSLRKRIRAHSAASAAGPPSPGTEGDPEDRPGEAEDAGAEA